MHGVAHIKHGLLTNQSKQKHSDQSQFDPTIDVQSLFVNKRFDAYIFIEY